MQSQREGERGIISGRPLREKEALFVDHTSNSDSIALTTNLFPVLKKIFDYILSPASFYIQQHWSRRAAGTKNPVNRILL